MKNRRDLAYASLDEALADMKLLLQGYTQHGKWDLEQAAKHLNDWLRFPMDGFPKAPLPIAMLMAILRNSIGPRLLRKIVVEKKMKDGVPTVPVTVYQTSHAAAAAQAAVEQLEQTINRFKSYSGPIHSSPVFGKMDKAVAEQLQLVHFAHHLSWLVPQPDGNRASL